MTPGECIRGRVTPGECIRGREEEDTEQVTPGELAGLNMG